MKVLSLVIILLINLSTILGRRISCASGCEYTPISGCSCDKTRIYSNCKGPLSGICPCGCRLNFKKANICDCSNLKYPKTYPGTREKFPLNKNEKQNKEN